MTFVQPADVSVGDPTTASNQNAQNAAIGDLNSRLSSVEFGVVPNGSFEIDDDSDGEPDSWTVTDVAGGSHLLDTTKQIGGLQTLKCVSTGGGGYVTAETSFIEGGNVGGDLNAWVQTDTTGVRYRVQILEYDTGLSLTNTLTVIDTTLTDVDNWIRLSDMRIPVEGPFFTVKIIVGEAGGAIAANVWTDQIQYFARSRDTVIEDGTVAAVNLGAGAVTTKRSVGYVWLTPNTNTIDLWLGVAWLIALDPTDFLKIYIDSTLEVTLILDTVGVTADRAMMVHRQITPTITSDAWYLVEYEVKANDTSQTTTAFYNSDSIKVS